MKSGRIREIFWLLPVLPPLLPVVSHFSFVSTWKRSHFSLWFQSSGSPGTILNRLSFWLKLYLIRNNTFMCCTMSSSFHSSIQVVRSYIDQRSNLENILKVSNSQCYQGIIKDNVRLWISPYFKMWKCFNTSA